MNGLTSELDLIVYGLAVIVLDSSFVVGFHKDWDAHHQNASVLTDQFLAGKWGRGFCDRLRHNSERRVLP